MALVSTAQITITDQNDYIFTGPTAPLNPAANNTLWIDTSLSPSQQKRWTGSKWEIVNEVVFGAKNLILNSKVSFTTNQYAVTQLNLSENLIEGQEYVFTAISTSGTATLGLWRDEGLVYVGSMPVVNGRHILKFICPPKAAQSSLLNRISVWNLSTPNTIGVSNFMLQKGNKELDYSPAHEDAEAAINAINSTLSDISNDNKLTADEKQTVKKEWDAIAGEYSKLIAQADSLSVSRTVYAGVYSTLNSYLSPLIANLNTTSDIVGSTFRNNFTNYYNARTDLQNAITAKVQSNLNNTKPAGKNYLINSRTDNLTAWFLDGGTATVVADAKYKNVVEYSRPSGGGNFMKSFPIDRSELKNTELIYYCIAKPISANPVFGFGGWSETVGHLNQNSSYRDLGDGWRLYFRVFNAGGEIASSGTLGLNSVGGTWRFHSFGVCKGNQPPADWSAAPEDTQAQINAANYLKTAIAQVTEVNGGLVLAAALCARDTNGQVRAYLNGLAQKAYAVAAGVSGWGTAQESAKSWIDFLGNAKFGNLRIGINGEGKTWIEDQNGVTRFQFSVENIETLASLLNAAGQSTNVTVQSFTTYTEGEHVLAQTITVNADDSELTLSGGITATVQVAPPNSANCAATLTLYRNGVLYATIANVFVSATGTNEYNEIEQYVETSTFNTKLIGVPAGTYSLRVVTDMEFFSSGSASVITSNISLFAFKSNDNRAMVFGADGLSLFWDQYKYFHIKNGVYASRGAWDIPAGLGGATIGSNGIHSNVWGLAHSATRSTNTTTIKHNVTDTKFTVNVTPKNSFTWHLQSITAASSPTANDGNIVIVSSINTAVFDIVVVRTPY